MSEVLRTFAGYTNWGPREADQLIEGRCLGRIRATTSRIGCTIRQAASTPSLRAKSAASPLTPMTGPLSLPRRTNA